MFASASSVGLLSGSVAQDIGGEAGAAVVAGVALGSLTRALLRVPAAVFISVTLFLPILAFTLRGDMEYGPVVLLGTVTPATVFIELVIARWVHSIDRLPTPGAQDS